MCRPLLAFMAYMKNISIIAFFAISAGHVLGQSQDPPANPQPPDSKERIILDGEIVTAKVEDGDTLILADLENVSITSFRTFESDTEYRRYMRYRRYASQVYPYAVKTIMILRQIEEDTDGMKNRKRRRHIKQLQKDLKDEFTDPLKDLSRTQGKILIKMIENELDTAMFDLLKDVKNGFEAGKWQTFSKFYGYDLKEGYLPGQDPILDAVLQDFDISYEGDD